MTINDQYISLDRRNVTKLSHTLNKIRNLCKEQIIGHLSLILYYHNYTWLVLFYVVFAKMIIFKNIKG